MKRNVPKFNDLDILRLILNLNEKKSRNLLAKELYIGEGSIRTILSILKNKKLISIDKKGIFFSKKGKYIFNEIYKTITPIKKIKSLDNSRIFKDGYKCYALLLRNYNKEKLEHPYRARDYGIRQGAFSSMILTYKNNNIILENFKRFNFNFLKKYFPEIGPNNLIILTSAENKRISHNSLLAIIKYLSNEDTHKYFTLLQKEICNLVT